MRPITTAVFICLALALTGAPAAATEGDAGIGAWLQTRGDETWITSLAKGGAADRAGLRPGVSVVAIDGRAVAGTEIEGLNDMLAGVLGSRVELTLLNGTKVALIRDMSAEVASERLKESWNLRPAEKMEVLEPACLVDLARAAYKGDGAARARLIKFTDGKGNVAEVRWRRHAAQAGEVESMYEYATACLSGRDCPVDTAAAIQWLEAAREKGHPMAFMSLAALGLGGDWRPADPRALVEAYTQAMAFSDPIFELALGRLYETGDRVPRDFAKARAHYREAAGLAPVEAALALARMTEQGLGGKPDPAAARRVLEQAWRGLPAEEDRAGNDDKNADDLALALGSYHEEGRGTAKDAAKAASYYLASASSRTKFRGAALLDGLPGAAARARKAYRAAAELAAENDPLDEALSRLRDAGKEVEAPIVALLEQAGSAGSGEADFFLARHPDVHGGAAEAARVQRHLERAAAHDHVPAWCRLALDAERRGDTAGALAAYRRAAAAYRAPAPAVAAATDLVTRALQRHDERFATHGLDSDRADLWRDAPLATIETEAQARAYIDRAELARWFGRMYDLDLWKTPGLRAEERERLLVASLFERKAELAAPAAAQSWRRMAADLGDPTAQFRLGQAFELGLGVARQAAEASFWYQLADAAGLDFAHTAWKGWQRVHPGLNAAERVDVAARVKTWWEARYP